MKPMKSSLSRLLGIGFLALILAGCSTTRAPIISEWRNPAYVSPPFKRIMIGGPSDNVSVRRSFEDEFIVQLQAAGVDGLASYRYISENEGIDETKLKQAAQQARVDAVLFARSVKMEQKTNFGPAFPEFSFGIFGSQGGAAWSGLPGGTSAYRYNEYTSETVLYDLAKNELVWSGTAKTTEPENVQSAIRSYVEAVIKALEAQNLLPGRH
jgi:hypothetical protein